MKYYILKDSTGNDIGNISGIQIDTRSPNYPYNAENSFQFIPNLAPPEVTPNFDYLIVEPKAYMTDFISCTGIINATGFIVSEKGKQLFEQFNLMRRYFYPVRLLHKHKFYQYYWLQPAEDFIYDVDYHKSSFIIRKPPLWDIPGWDDQKTAIEIDSVDTMISLRKKNAGISVITPTVLHMKHPLLAMMAFSSFDNEKVIVSEKLKEAISDRHLTGIELYETSNRLVTA